MAGDANKQGRNDAHPVEGMAKLSPCPVQAQDSQRITANDFLVAAATTEEGRAGRCSVLDIKADALDEVLQDARDAFGKKRHTELLAPRPGGSDDDQQQPADGPATGGEGR